jgi:hypothetical protein
MNCYRPKNDFELGNLKLYQYYYVKFDDKSGDDGPKAGSPSRLFWPDQALPSVTDYNLNNLISDRNSAGFILNFIYFFQFSCVLRVLTAKQLAINYPSSRSTRCRVSSLSLIVLINYQLINYLINYQLSELMKHKMPG